MNGIMHTPLDAWAAGKTGAGREGLTRGHLDRYQLAKLKETVAWARRKSPFYRALLANCPESGPVSLEDFRRFPFTSAEDLRCHGPRFLCVSQSDISRVVTLDSSGTTGDPKRLYFTVADQEATIDFFRTGMAGLTTAGDRVLILLPGIRPGGVGDLLATALRRSGIQPVPHGPVADIPAALAALVRERANCVVGVPAQVLALARWGESAGLPIRIKSVLLSTDYVPRAVVRELRRLWGCDVFEHYGMTELGLGGGTDCAAHAGYHLHEADFLFEIVDPATGNTVPEGGYGEVVVTTLVRRGMPLIRYRTGDLSRFIPGPCPCGSPLRRLAPVAGRKGGEVAVPESGHFTLAELDEALYAVPGLIAFTATVDSYAGASRLAISAALSAAPDAEREREISAAVEAVPAIGAARRAGRLIVAVTAEKCRGELMASAAKRVIAEWG
jgi:phenylacetate-CoA ligase